MFNILKSLLGIPEHLSRADTTPDSSDPDANDMWAFTDPDARDYYERNGELQKLERDVRFEVMRGGAWLPAELTYKSEIRRLLREGALKDSSSYWYVSPHPTVYRAVRDGALTVGGRTISFRAGQDIVFQCRMMRDRFQEDASPVLVARLEPTDNSMLCGEMQQAMKGTGKQSGMM